VAPDDDDAILEGLRALIDDDHQERILAARARAEAFTWQASADRLLASFRQAMID
jgi:glycosyltransferase involved in cell wall biosynthesis